MVRCMVRCMVRFYDSGLWYINPGILKDKYTEF
jgi:hypothetical protein